MSQIMQYAFRLFGPRKGHTVKINGHQFIKGEFRAVVSPEVASSLVRVLSYYGAYAKGTPEYDAALAKEEAANGAGEVHTGAQRGSADAVPGNGESNGAGPSSAPADNGPGAARDQAGSSGSGADGSGHGDAGVPKFEEAADWQEPGEPASVGSDTIKAAVLKLDPENDDHWVNTGAHKGKPRLSAVEDAYGKAGLTRDDLEAAIPSWTRDKALEAALEG